MNITHNKQERGWIGLIAQKESKKKTGKNTMLKIYRGNGK